MNELEIEDSVTIYRINNPDCSYCQYSDKNIPIGRVPECLALKCECWNSKKRAKKCILYIAERYNYDSARI